MIWPVLSSYRTPALYAGAALLVVLGSFGLGFYKGKTAGAAIVATRVAEIAKVDQKRIDEKKATDSKTDEDVVVTKETLPPQKMPDGSIRRQTRIHKSVAKKEEATVEATAHSDVAEKSVERVAEAKGPPCPAGPPVPSGSIVNPFVEPQTRLDPPRFLLGPMAVYDLTGARSWHFGGSGAVRTGPVFWRIAVDSHPQVTAGVEVYWK